MIINEYKRLEVELKTSEQVAFKGKDLFGKVVEKVDYKATEELLRAKLEEHYSTDKVFIFDVDKYNGVYRAEVFLEEII